MKISSGKPFCIIGHVYDLESDSTELKSLLIVDGKIIGIIDGVADSNQFPDFTRIHLKEDEIIFPPFINLHAHIGYNILPLWDSGNSWNSRHQWRNNAKYKLEISGLVNFISEEWTKNPELLAEYMSAFHPEEFTALLTKEDNSEYLEVYKAMALSDIQKAHVILSEIMAVCGGTGVLLQTMPLDDEHPDEKNFIIRNTGHAADIGIHASKKIYAVVDFFKPCLNGTPPEKCGEWKPNGTSSEDTDNWFPQPVKDKNGVYLLNQFIDSVNNNNTLFHATIVHIGEGNSGNFKLKDPYSALESQKTMLELRNSIQDPDKLKEANLVFVHANGFDYNDAEVLNFFKEHHISIVWSPVSNLLLYKDTLPIAKLMEAGINVCLGTDWTPSGSKHMLDEMKFTRHLCDKLKLNISDADILKMSTLNPARAIGAMNLYAIRNGGNADFFVLKNPGKTKNASALLLASQDADIVCSMINGRFVYGDISFLDTLEVDYQKLPELDGEMTARKAVSLNKNINFDLQQALKKIDLLMKVYAEKLEKPVRRTKFLATDDPDYLARIETLKNAI